jgi:hypothetical protein
MKTSLTEIEYIERFINGELEPGEKLLFEARVITNPALGQRVTSQQNIYSIVNHYGREKLRKQIEDIHQQLFTDPEKKSFRQRILRIFH